jgi:hypothetical protein
MASSAWVAFLVLAGCSTPKVRDSGHPQPDGSGEVTVYSMSDFGPVASAIWY